MTITRYASLQIICIHGGLSQKISYLKEIESLKNSRDFDLEDTICDILWSDPNPNLYSEKWELSFRGLGYFFSFKALEKFLKENKLEYMIRAHESVPQGESLGLTEGVKMDHNGLCFTVYSCPDEHTQGAIININEVGEMSMYC